MTGNGQPEPSRATRWLLWLSLLHTLPAPFFLFVVIGTVPAAGLLAAGVAGLFAGDREGLAMGAVLGVQGTGYAVLYFLVAWLLEFLLRRLRAVPLRSGVLAILVAAMFAATLAPIYGSGGHGVERWTNLPGLLSEFAAPPVGPWLAPYFGALGLVLAGLLVLQAVAIPPVLQRLADRWPPLPVQIGLLALLLGSMALYSNRVVVFCMPAAQANQVWAQLCIARAARERAEAGRYADAESWYARAAEQGSSTAMRELLEITRSPDVRRRWLAVLAAEGDAGARVAWWELVRNDAAADRSTALAWLTEAAGDGHPRAALELARHLIDAGEPDTGRTWLEVAAEADQGDALRELAWRYEQGAPGFPIDLERAAALYAQLAEGIDQGRHETRMYTQTASGYREQADSIRALLQAADSGDPTAQARLGERILDSR
ncbi:MAG: hypothetical protein OEW88_10425, partial [Gammaproteobacteria bacterium]|nr:hypothetical protein [Gammaproteobacteria bacterium]